MNLTPVTIGTTRTKILDGVGPTVRKWYVCRWPLAATETLYVGGKDVTTANGIPIYPGDFIGDANRYGAGFPANEELWGVVGSAEAQTLRIRVGK